MSDASLRTPFPARAHAALEDAHLQEALGIATTKFIGLRKEAFAGFPEGAAGPGFGPRAISRFPGILPLVYELTKPQLPPLP